jgi:hypothetical protein
MSAELTKGKVMKGRVMKKVSKKGFKKGNQDGNESLLAKDPSELTPKQQYKLLMGRGFFTIDCEAFGKNYSLILII